MASQRKQRIKTRGIHKLVLLLMILYVAVLDIININSKSVYAAASELEITYDNQTINYKGPQITYQFYSKKVDMDDAPGIMISDIAFASYTDLFKNGLGATCSYNKKTKKIVIKKYDKKVEMTLDSKKAKINGKTVTLSEKPRMVKYNSVEKSKILVPVKVLLEGLGYFYKWDDSTSTVKISYNGWEEYYIDGKWNKYTGTKGKVVFDKKSINVTAMPAIIQDDTILVQAKKVFSDVLGAEYNYTSDSTGKKLILQKNGVVLEFTMGSNIALINGVKTQMSTKAQVIKNKKNGKSYVMIPAKFAITNLGYTYEWDDKENCVQIETRNAKVYFAWKCANVIENPQSPYTNFIKSVVSDTDGKDDKVTITGVNKITAQVSTNEKKDTIYIDIKNTLTDISDMTEKISDDSSKIKSVSIETTKDGGIRFSLKVTAGVEYYISSVGKEYTIHFAASEFEDSYAISFAKPENVEVNVIKDTDKYWVKKFVITIPGNFVEFYNKNPINKKSNIVKNVDVSLNKSGNTMITVTTTKLQGYRIDYSNDKILVKIDEPKKIYKNIVVLDPGHGGVDPGAVSNGINEKDIVYNILYTYGKKYFNAENSLVKAYWTRVNDKKIELNDRASFSESVGADCFISLHMNSASSTAKGTEVYYSATNNKDTASGLTSKKLAECFQKSIVDNLLTNSRGVKTAQFVVIKKNTVPAILVELGFISNKEDREKFTNRKYQKKTAKLFYDTIVDILKEYPANREGISYK